MPRILTPADVAEFRNRLCDVGATLFAEQGFDGFNMRELARRLGVSAMTPYRYFKDKGAIMSEVRTRAFARFADWLEEHLAAPQAAGTLGRAYAQYAVQEQMQYRLMFDLVQPASTALPALRAQEQRVRKAINAHLRTGSSREAGSGSDLPGMMLWSLLHGVTTLYLAGKVSSEDFDRSMSNAVRLFVGGVTEAKNCAMESALGNDPAAPWWQSAPQADVPAYESGI